MAVNGISQQAQKQAYRPPAPVAQTNVPASPTDAQLYQGWADASIDKKSQMIEADLNDDDGLLSKEGSNFLDQLEKDVLAEAESTKGEALTDEEKTQLDNWFTDNTDGDLTNNTSFSDFINDIFSNTDAAAPATGSVPTGGGGGGGTSATVAPATAPATGDAAAPFSELDLPEEILQEVLKLFEVNETTGEPELKNNSEASAMQALLDQLKALQMQMIGDGNQDGADQLDGLISALESGLNNQSDGESQSDGDSSSEQETTTTTTTTTTKPKASSSTSGVATGGMGG